MTVLVFGRKVLSLNFQNKTAIYSLKFFTTHVKTKFNNYLQLIRFDKPIGTWLVFWPGMWSLTLATHIQNKIVNTDINMDKILLTFPDPKLFLYFSLGSFLMRNSGCIINDMFDKRFDRYVKRTENRPLAANRLTKFNALTFLGLNLSGALLILLQLNNLTILLGVLALIPTITYPLSKRFFPWPQLHLGIVFNWGSLMGYSAVLNSLIPALPIALLYGGSIAWTLVYDTVYAHQDKMYDMQLGLHSTALYFARAPKRFLYSCAIFSNACFAGIGHTFSYHFNEHISTLLHFHPLYYIFIALNTIYMTWAIKCVDLNDPVSCGQHFKRHNVCGILTTLAFITGNASFL